VSEFSLEETLPPLSLYSESDDSNDKAESVPYLPPNRERYGCPITPHFVN